MTIMSETAPTSSIDRSDRPGNMGFLLVLSCTVIGAIGGLAFVASDKAQPLILGLLALLAMAGIFSLFGLAIGILQFAGRSARNDLTKTIVNTSREGIMVVDDDGHIIYANETYLGFSSATSGADVKTIERLFAGAPETSEAVYRLSSRCATDARRARRCAWRRRSPAARAARAGTGCACGRSAPGGERVGVWTVADITARRERQEKVFQELQHAIDYLDHAPAGFFSAEPAGASSTSTRRSPNGSASTSPSSSRGR